MPKTFAFLGVVILVALLLQSTAFAAVDAGAIYTERCQKCHGADGKADTPAGKKFEAHDFHSPDVQKKTDAELIKIITDGQKKMPSFKDKLSEEEIKALAAYVRQLGKK